MSHRATPAASGSWRRACCSKHSGAGHLSIHVTDTLYHLALLHPLPSGSATPSTIWLYHLALLHVSPSAHTRGCPPSNMLHASLTRGALASAVQQHAAAERTHITSSAGARHAAHTLAVRPTASGRCHLGVAHASSPGHAHAARGTGRLQQSPTYAPAISAPPLPGLPAAPAPGPHPGP
jgi:hypothetical protein